MEYKYHCQYQAEAFANAIIPVPENYPFCYLYVPVEKV